MLFVEKIFLWLLRWVSRISDRRHVNTTKNEMSPTDIVISNWFDVCRWSNISKTMLSWSGQLVLLVLMVGFPWNMARPQLHLLSLTVKISRCQASNSGLEFHIAITKNLQYKTQPEFDLLPDEFSKRVYYKTRLILETRRYVWFCGHVHSNASVTS